MMRIGIIMDGNRRYTRKIIAKPWEGHRIGSSKIKDLVDWCIEFSIKELTLYTFSKENFKRSKKEIEYLMKLFVSKFEELKDYQLIYDKKVRIQVVGDISEFPVEVKNRIKDITERTKDHDNFILNFAMGYSGRDEIVNAVKKISAEVKDGKLKIDEINEDMVNNCLYLKNEPDFIIRTGGDYRTSNFLMWQSAYSEWIFSDKLWPEFDKEDLINAIKEFKNRERRFGK